MKTQAKDESWHIAAIVSPLSPGICVQPGLYKRHEGSLDATSQRPSGKGTPETVFILTLLTLLFSLPPDSLPSHHLACAILVAPRVPALPPVPPLVPSFSSFIYLYIYILCVLCLFLAWLCPLF